MLLINVSGSLLGPFANEEQVKEYLGFYPEDAGMILKLLPPKSVAEKKIIPIDRGDGDTDVLEASVEEITKNLNFHMSTSYYECSNGDAVEYLIAYLRDRHEGRNISELNLRELVKRYMNFDNSDLEIDQDAVLEKACKKALYEAEQNTKGGNIFE